MDDNLGYIDDFFSEISTLHMGVSWNGVPAVIIHFNGVFYIQHPFWGTPILGNLHIHHSLHPPPPRLAHVRQRSRPGRWGATPWCVVDIWGLPVPPVIIHLRLGVSLVKPSSGMVMSPIFELETQKKCKIWPIFWYFQMETCWVSTCFNHQNMVMTGGPGQVYYQLWLGNTQPSIHTIETSYDWGCHLGTTAERLIAASDGNYHGKLEWWDMMNPLWTWVFRKYHRT